VAIVKLLQRMGVRDVILCDTKGIIYEGRPNGMNPFNEEMARTTNKAKKQGTLADALVGADVFVGVSAAGAVTKEMVLSMHRDPIIFAMANPTPEVMPNEAKSAGALVVGTGRSDFPNQVNNVLAFPGIFRGALDVQAKEINEEMKLAAVNAIAGLISDEELCADYVIPDPFDRRVAAHVAAAVANAAIETEVAQKYVSVNEIKQRMLELAEENKPVLV
jgi:malate dehydrogenase (oxaloacetate-decarboxylating)